MWILEIKEKIILIFRLIKINKIYTKILNWLKIKYEQE